MKDGCHLWQAWFVAQLQGRPTHRSSIGNHASLHKKNIKGRVAVMVVCRMQLKSCGRVLVFLNKQERSEYLGSSYMCKNLSLYRRGKPLSCFWATFHESNRPKLASKPDHSDFDNRKSNFSAILQVVQICSNYYN